MVSSIGDKNAHCLLRSSIGQLVTSLPANYVVLSLYLFLIWLLLFILELTTGPMQHILLLVVVGLFFQTVVSLSAFGRLIIHTGAMGSRPVLDPALEKALLPRYDEERARVGYFVFTVQYIAHPTEVAVGCMHLC